MKPRTPLIAIPGALAVASAIAGIVWAATPARVPGDWTPTEEVVDDPTALVPDEELRDQLGGIDYVPGREALDPLLGDDPTGALIEIATTAGVDSGLRLRALRALAMYPGAATIAALDAEVAQWIDQKDGVELLYLGAAMRSLAVLAGDSAVHTIRPALDHDSKDVRAAAAAALGATGAKSASTWLYERLGVETDDMVKLALSDAIRALDEQ